MPVSWIRELSKIPYSDMAWHMCHTLLAPNTNYIEVITYDHNYSYCMLKIKSKVKRSSSKKSNIFDIFELWTMNIWQKYYVKY